MNSPPGISEIYHAIELQLKLCADTARTLKSRCPIQDRLVIEWAMAASGRTIEAEFMEFTRPREAFRFVIVFGWSSRRDDGGCGTRADRVRYVVCESKEI